MTFRSMQSCRKTLSLVATAAAIVVVAVSGATGADDAIRSGDNIVTRVQSEVKVGRQVLATIEKGVELVAREVRGEWVSVAVLREGSTIRGWVKKANVAKVVPDSQREPPDERQREFKILGGVLAKRGDMKVPCMLVWGGFPFSPSPLEVDGELPHEHIIRIESYDQERKQLVPTPDSAVPKIGPSHTNSQIVTLTHAVNVVWQFVKPGISFEADGATYVAQEADATISFTDDGVNMKGIEKRENRPAASDREEPRTTPQAAEPTASVVPNLADGRPITQRNAVVAKTPGVINLKESPQEKQNGAASHGNDVEPTTAESKRMPDAFIGKWISLGNKNHYVLVLDNEIRWERGGREGPEVVLLQDCELLEDGRRLRFQVKAGAGAIVAGRPIRGSVAVSMARSDDSLVIEEQKAETVRDLASGFAFQSVAQHTWVFGKAEAVAEDLPAEPASAVLEDAPAAQSMREPVPGRAFADKLAEWKGVLQQLQKLKADYGSAGLDRAEAIRTQWDEKMALAESLLAELREAGKQAFLAAPNADPELTQFLIAVVTQDVADENYGPAADLSQALLEGGCQAEGLYDLAGRAAFGTKRYDKAKQYLTRAGQRRTLSAEGRQCLAAIDRSGEEAPERLRNDYRDSKERFTLEPPPGWEIREFPDDPRSKVRFEAPGDAASIGIIARVEEATTLDELVAEKEAVAAEWRQQMPNGSFKVTKTTLGNRPVVKVGFALPSGHKQVIYFFMAAGCHFNLGYSAMSGTEFDRYEAAAMAAFASLHPGGDPGPSASGEMDAERLASAVRQIQIVFNTDGVNAAVRAARELRESAPDNDQARHLCDDLVRIAQTPIVFLSRTDDTTHIYTARVDGSDLRRLTNARATEDMPAFSPDGKRIVFRSESDGNQDIWVIGVDGSHPTRLTNNPDKDSGPCWSPDGSRILYARKFQGEWALWSMAAADGSNPQEVLSGAAGGAYSPDGTMLVFTEGMPPQGWTVPIAGGDATTGHVAERYQQFIAGKLD